MFHVVYRRHSPWCLACGFSVVWLCVCICRLCLSCLFLAILYGALFRPTPAVPFYTRVPECFLVLRSSGVVLWQVLTRRQPFEGLTPIQAAFSVARQGLRPPLPQSAPSALSSLIGRCWHRSPNARPSFSQVRDIWLVVERVVRCLFVVRSGRSHAQGDLCRGSAVSLLSDSGVVTTRGLGISPPSEHPPDRFSKFDCSTSKKSAGPEQGYHLGRSRGQRSE